jgi:arsenite-transporting ATPase
MRPFAAMMGRREVIPPDSLFDALLRLSDELTSVRGLLADPAVTSVRLVLTPESVVAAEARRTFTALALYGYRVDLVIANRVFARDRDAFRSAWADAQQAQLAALRESFAGRPLREVPFAPAEPVGVEALRRVAEALYGALPGEDPARTPEPVELMSVDAEGDEYVLRMWLPLVERSAVDAARAGDDLVLTVAGHRRVLTLPSVLRRCDVVGGEFADRQLRVRFRPNPAMWPAALTDPPQAGPRGTA